MSFDDPVGAHKEFARNGDAEGLGRLEVDRQVEFHRLLDGQVRRFGAAENLVDVDGRPAEYWIPVYSIGNQAPQFDVFANGKDSGKPQARDGFVGWRVMDAALRAALDKGTPAEYPIFKMRRMRQ